jgi:hypothetical protein
MPGLSRELVEHWLLIKSGFRPYKQPAGRFNPDFKPYKQPAGRFNLIIHDQVKEEVE